MPAATFKTTVVVFEIKPFHTGTNQKTQREYTIWQIRARKMDGQEIKQYPLRSFDKLPLNEPIEVEAQLYDGGSYGISYTLKPLQKTNSSSGGLGPRVEALEAQVAALYTHLNLTPPAAPQPTPEAPQQSTAPPPAPAAPTASPPPQPPAPPAPVSTPPQPAPNSPTQVGTSPVQPEPPGGYGTHNEFGGDEDIPF
jgi:hypothetical protein